MGDKCSIHSPENWWIHRLPRWQNIISRNRCTEKGYSDWCCVKWVFWVSEEHLNRLLSLLTDVLLFMVAKRFVRTDWKGIEYSVHHAKPIFAGLISDLGTVHTGVWCFVPMQKYANCREQASKFVIAMADLNRSKGMPISLQFLQRLQENSSTTSTGEFHPVIDNRGQISTFIDWLFFKHPKVGCRLPRCHLPLWLYEENEMWFMSSLWLYEENEMWFMSFMLIMATSPTSSRHTIWRLPTGDQS
jgi:hypothetical protein